ncbi:MAG: glycine--tRNA ligase [Phycisphaerales bacterium]|nr:glycine--tRNA ligase [Phycisphaerales bacterium]
MPDNDAPKSMEDLVALCKRRGFIYPASEIYGGLNGFWDYGPLGTELKNNLRDAWWNDMVKSPPVGPNGEPLVILGLDSSIIQHPKVWEASGHVGGFNDLMVEDSETKKRFRADHLQGIYLLEPAGDMKVGEPYLVTSLMERAPDHTLVASSPAEALSILIAERKMQKLMGIRALKSNPLSGHSLGKPPYAAVWVDTDHGSRYVYAESVPIDVLQSLPGSIPSPFTGDKGALAQPRQFNLMFQTYYGAVFDEDHKTYLRPETAQGIFLNFKNVVDTMRVKVPFGIAQIGKAFRNEVTPRNFIFRSREFEQMEIEFFCHGDDAPMWYEYWCEVRKNWWQSVGLTGDNIQMRQHENEELAHYAKDGCGTFDIEYRFPFTHPGFGELEGVAHRSDFDLRQHREHSGAKLEYFDQERNERYLPHVIEPSGGLSRGVLALLCEAFTPTPERKGSKYVMCFHPRMAPVKAAIFPLVNKEGMPEIARKLYDDLRTRWPVQFDVKQSIGKRYARMDEAGTPYCFTIDGETLEDQTVTVRERDTADQKRIAIDQVARYVADETGG